MAKNSGPGNSFSTFETVWVLLCAYTADRRACFLRPPWLDPAWQRLALLFHFVSAPARMGSHSSRKVRKRVESPICPDPCSSFCSPGFHVPTMLTICVMPFNNMRCVFQCPVFRRNLTKMCFSSGQICSKTSPFVLRQNTDPASLLVSNLHTDHHGIYRLELWYQKTNVT